MDCFNIMKKTTNCNVILTGTRVKHVMIFSTAKHLKEKVSSYCTLVSVGVVLRLDSLGLHGEPLWIRWYAWAWVGTGIGSEDGDDEGLWTSRVDGRLGLVWGSVALKNVRLVFAAPTPFSVRGTGSLWRISTHDMISYYSWHRLKPNIFHLPWSFAKWG